MPYQLLILDDFKISNEVLSSLLEGMGYKIYSCQQSRVALELLMKIRVDAIITDYFIPGMNGIEFLKEVRQIQGYDAVPVIFLSSTENQDVINSALKYNITAWLKKPVKIDQLKDILNKVLS